MKLVIVDPPFSPSHKWDRFGFSDIVLGYANGLINEVDVEVHVIGSYANEPDNSKIQWHLIKAGPNDIRNVVAQMLLLRKYAKVVKFLKPSYVHSPDYLSLAVVTKDSPAITPVLITPGSISERLATFNPYDWTYTTALKWARNTLLRHPATIILASSDYMARWWQQDGFRRVYTVPLPVTTEPLILKQEARKRLGWKKDTIHLLFVASLRSENRVTEMRHFWLSMVRNDSLTEDWLLHVIGDGPDRHHLVTVDQSPQLQLEGAVPYSQLSLYYSAATCLVVSRRFNATPRVALESLCYGTPVLANNNPSLDGFSDVAPYIFQQNISNDSTEILRETIMQADNLGGEQEKIAIKARNIFDSAVVSHRLYNMLQAKSGTYLEGLL